jgi:hypothetical protein
VPNTDAPGCVTAFSDKGLLHVFRKTHAVSHLLTNRQCTLIERIAQPHKPELDN